jgi:hypothetical protein
MGSSDSEPGDQEISDPKPPKRKSQRRTYVRNPLQRKEILENDVWAKNVTKTSVDCRGCGKTLALDGRRDYYLGLWEKHRDRCPAIRQEKGEEPLPRVYS